MMRIRCCVPFCNRTRKNDLGFSEWMCGDHWREVPKMKRRAYGRLTRRLRRGMVAGNEDARAARLWRRLKAVAIERAAGL